MLKTRVITAVLLLAVFVPALMWLPQVGWAVFMAGAAGVAGWEWGGFMRLAASRRVTFGVALCGACLLWVALAPATLGAAGGPASPETVLGLYVCAALFWSVVVPLWLRHKWSLRNVGLGLLCGAVVILPCWAAIVQLRMLGVGPFLAILIAVWVADIAAYFCGRTFGRHKLAVNISPGKTWEGAIGGGACVVIYGLVMREVFGFDNSPVWLWVFILAAGSAVSVVGDLFESLLKRQVGLKDSSNILPGHGGVMDRIDSLTSTLPFAALILLLFGHPGL